MTRNDSSGGPDAEDVSGLAVKQAFLAHLGSIRECYLPDVVFLLEDVVR